jgi:hypothetical protein
MLSMYNNEQKSEPVNIKGKQYVPAKRGEYRHGHVNDGHVQ